MMSSITWWLQMQRHVQICQPSLSFIRIQIFQMDFPFIITLPTQKVEAREGRWWAFEQSFERWRHQWVGLGLGGTMTHYCIAACSEVYSLASNLAIP